ncbi:MAG TPA: 1-pyrroline-5-carboxylate dehydrogenase, partial [Methylomirabilota bacterium]|nr:1-pyrroline-5-carboxylate dehydrogenase [Methylomirabilota bacterium]
MANAVFNVPTPRNEPILTYAPGTPERQALRGQLQRMASEVIEITPRIGGRAVKTGRIAEATMPHDHRHVLATWHKAGAREVDQA